MSCEGRALGMEGRRELRVAQGKSGVLNYNGGWRTSRLEKRRGKLTRRWRRSWRKR